MAELYDKDPLYLAIMSNDPGLIAKLKREGATLSEHIKYAMTHPVWGSKENEYSWTCWAHSYAIQKMKKERFVAVMTNLHNEIGEPLHYTESIYWSLRRDICDHDVFKCIVNCFDNKKINKKVMMQEVIKADDAELLALTAERGWLKAPRKRDEMIKYATDNNKTECLAWLLDFKNRTANLEEEQEKAEKKLMRELNASPDSVSELKKRWGWQKQEDGTIIITSCKKSIAERTEITVPATIGKTAVTAIGMDAFSPYARRTDEEISAFRKKITKITLPDSIKSILGSAFSYCESLEEINIPDGIEVINEGTFSCCRSLKEVRLPDSVRSLEAAFSACYNLEKVNIPEGVEVIHNNSFSSCSALKEIRIPKSVCKIAPYAFAGCESLENIIFEKGVERICQHAFWQCKSLKTLVIPEGTEEIWQLAFEDCQALETIYLPRSLKRIKNQSVKGGTMHTAFHGCPNIKAVVYEGSYAYKYCRRNNIPYEIVELN